MCSWNRDADIATDHRVPLRVRISRNSILPQQITRRGEIDL